MSPTPTIASSAQPSTTRVPERRRWCWGTRVLLAASLSWLLFVASHLLLSGRVWWWAPVEPVPPLLFAVVPLLLAVVAPLARPIRWRLLLLVLVTAVLGAGSSGVNLAGLWYSPPPAPPDAVTVVSWNTEYWDQNWRHGGQGLDRGFYEYLRELDADVYLLKEYIHIEPVFPLRLSRVFAVDRVARLRAEFPGFHIAVAGKQVTLSRFPIVRQRGLEMTPWLPEELREVPPELAEFPEFNTETLRTDIRVGERVVSFYNTHIYQPADSLDLWRGASRREAREAHHRRTASFEALRADVDGNPRPVVVGADLNTSPAMGMSRLLPDRLEDRTPALGSLYPRTWQVDGFHLGPIALELWQIDWLFTTADVAVHRYELADPAGLSDHRVLRALVSTATP